MQMKKAILVARVQKKLDKLAAVKKEYEDALPIYMKELEEYYRNIAEQVKQAAGDYATYRAAPNLPKPNYPELPYSFENQVSAAKRNMAILEALEGDFIEVEKLRTGRNFSLESLFEGMLGE